MKKDKKIFLKNTFYLYLMNVIKLFFPLLTLPYLTRVLSTESYGMVTYVKSIIVYVQLIIDFGFLLSATKEIVNEINNKNKIEKIIGDTLVEKILLGILSCILYIIAMQFIPIMGLNPLFCILYLLSALSTIFILDFFYRGIEKMSLVAIPYIIAKTITTILTFILVKEDNDLLLIPILELIGNCIAAVISTLSLHKLGYKIKITNLQIWIKDLKDSLVYFISNFATTIFGALTTIIAGSYIPIDKIAFWGICMQILSAAKALYNPITNSLYPYMIRKKDLAIIRKICLIMLIPMAIGSILLIFKADLIMLIIGGQKYIYASKTLKLLLPSFIFSFYSMIYGWPVLGAIGKAKETSVSTVTASIIQLIGLAFLGYFKYFNLYTLAICCDVAEISLFVIRFGYYIKYKDLFNNK